MIPRFRFVPHGRGGLHELERLLHQAYGEPEDLLGNQLDPIEDAQMLGVCDDDRGNRVGVRFLAEDAQAPGACDNGADDDGAFLADRSTDENRRGRRTLVHSQTWPARNSSGSGMMPRPVHLIACPPRRVGAPARHVQS